MKKTTKMAVVLAAMSVMVLGAATMVSAAGKQGWVKEGSDWYYYNEKEEKLVNSWAQDSSGLWYFLGEDAKMLKNAFVDGEDNYEVAHDEISRADDGEFYYLSEDGAMVANTWTKAKTADAANKNTPYAGDEGTAWYYFDANGKMYGNAWVLSGTEWFYVGDDGKMLTHELLNGKYYLKGNGAMVTGWYQATDKDEEKATGITLAEKDWVWAKDNGELVKADWKKVDSKWYFFGSVSGSLATEDYVMVSNSLINDSEGSFVITKSGAMATGWARYDVDQDGETDDVYADTSKGKLVSDSVKKLSNKFYYFGADFISVDEGWVLESGDVLTFSTTEPTGVSGDVIYKLGTLVKRTVK